MNVYIDGKDTVGGDAIYLFIHLYLTVLIMSDVSYFTLFDFKVFQNAAINEKGYHQNK